MPELLQPRRWRGEARPGPGRGGDSAHTPSADPAGAAKVTASRSVLLW